MTRKPGYYVVTNYDWDLEQWVPTALYRIEPDGTPRRYDMESGWKQAIPATLVKEAWRAHQRIAERHPKKSRIQAVPPEDVPAVELDLNIQHQQRFEYEMNFPVGAYVILNEPNALQDYGYARVVEKFEDRDRKILILGKDPSAKAKTFQKLYEAIDGKRGPQIHTVDRLGPGKTYILEIGSTLASPKWMVLDLREKHSEWIHLPDEELDMDKEK